MPVYRSATSTSGRNMAGARALWRATGVKGSDLVPSLQGIPPFSPSDACRFPHAAAAMARSLHW